MNDIGHKLADVRLRIAAACARAGRSQNGITLIAISKTQPAAALAAAAAAGQWDFGESYVQEAIAKMAIVEQPAGQPLAWHFIGPIQSNKTQTIAAHFAWAHSIDRLKIAERLSTQRPDSLPPMNVCVQVNVSGEASKSGCAPAEAAALCEAVAALPRLRLRGLMCVPEAADEAEATRPAFRRLAELRRQILDLARVDAGDFDSLSMGMSDDFEIAIEEGATLVRVGSAIFGARSRKLVVTNN